MYINSSEMPRVYRHDWPLWLVCPLIVYCWINRVWLFAKRCKLAEDPILFAFRDYVSLLVGLIAFL